MNATERNDPSSSEIDLDAVAKLVEKLEQDLATIQGSKVDVQRLKDEVQTLKNVLHSPVRRHHWVRDALHGIRDAFDTVAAKGAKGSQYIAEIGRILGM